MYVKLGVLAGMLALVAACGDGANRAGDGRADAFGTAADEAAAPILVSAAASLSEAMGAVAAEYEADTGTPVRLNVAGSQMLASQIIEGAPVDLFVSADALQMDRAAAAGRVDAATRVDLLSNQLVVAVPDDRAGTVTAPGDLAGPAIERLALGDPEAVPAGVYARDWLVGVGVWDDVAPKVAPASSVRAALRAVESGAADAGIVYRTDMQTSTRRGSRVRDPDRRWARDRLSRRCRYRGAEPRWRGPLARLSSLARRAPPVRRRRIRRAAVTASTPAATTP